MRFLFALTLFAISSLAQAQQVNYEAGTDWRNSYAESPAFAQAISGMLRISDMRAYYGLRLAEASESRFRGRSVAGTSRLTAVTALATYKSFPFDLEGDCNCPTWGKEGWLQKHLFVEIGAGGALVQRRETSAGDPPVTLSVTDERKFGAGYLLRSGLSVKLVKQFEVYLAASAAGVLHREFSEAGNSTTPNLIHDIGLQGTLGLTYRWRTKSI